MIENGKILRIEDYLREKNVGSIKDEFCGKILDLEEYKIEKDKRKIRREYYQGNCIMDDID